MYHAYQISYFLSTTNGLSTGSEPQSAISTSLLGLSRLLVEVFSIFLTISYKTTDTKNDIILVIVTCILEQNNHDVVFLLVVACVSLRTSKAVFFAL